MMIIKFFNFHLREFLQIRIKNLKYYLPSDFIAFRIMFKGNWKITAFIKFTKSSWFAITDACCLSRWWSINLENVHKYLLISRKNKVNTLAFFKRDFTVKPSVSKCPVGRNREFVEVTTDMIYCRLFECFNFHISGLLFVGNNH